MAFDAQDPFDIESQLDDGERMLRDYARARASELLPPLLNRPDAARSALARLGEAGLLGVQLPIAAGGRDASAVAFGLVCRELDRIDSGFRTGTMVQDTLVIQTLHSLGSDDHNARLLPDLIAGRTVGAFGLTEPDAGSDLGAVATRAERVGGGYRLTGRKVWITNAAIADTIIVWARSEIHDGQLRAFIVERGAPGLATARIPGRLALHCADVADIDLRSVFVPDTALLPGAVGSKAAFECLNRARLGTAWGVLGAASDCLDRAIAHGLKRHQFGRPLAATQLYQRKLADMTTELGLATQATLRFSRMVQIGGSRPDLGGLVKRNNCAKALDIARSAREMQGATGLLDDQAVMRHAQNLEAVSTYEGSHDVLALSLGRAITGIAAF